MTGPTGVTARTYTVTMLGALHAILWTARHPNQDGRTDADAFALIARIARSAIDREPWP